MPQITLAQIKGAAAGLLGRVSGSGSPVTLTAAQATALLDVATPDAKGLLSAADKTKLNNVGGATNAELRDRATHTGTQAISTVAGLGEALDSKQPSGSYISSSQLALKADALTAVVNRTASVTVTDALHNGAYNRITGANSVQITFGNPSPGHAAIWVNRSAVAQTIICPGGYYKNGSTTLATANLALVVGGKLTAFHEADGVWTLEGTGF